MFHAAGESDLTLHHLHEILHRGCGSRILAELLRKMMASDDEVQTNKFHQRIIHEYRYQIIGQQMFWYMVPDEP